VGENRREGGMERSKIESEGEAMKGGGGGGRA